MRHAQLSVDEKNNGQHFSPVWKRQLHQDNCLSLQNLFKKIEFHMYYPQWCVVLTFARSRITKNNWSNSLEVKQPTTHTISRNMVPMEKCFPAKLVFRVLGNSLNAKKYDTPTLETVKSISKELVGRNRQGLWKQQVRRSEVKEVLHRTSCFDDTRGCLNAVQSFLHSALFKKSLRKTWMPM